MSPISISLQPVIAMFMFTTDGFQHIKLQVAQMSLEKDEDQEFTASAARTKLQLSHFVDGKKVNLETENKPREVVKKHLFNLIKCLVDGLYIVDSLSWDRCLNKFAKVFTNLTWYNAGCARKNTCSIFVEIFVTLAFEYSSLVPVFLKILVDVAFTLNPPEKYDEPLGFIMSGVTEILNRYPSPRDDELFKNLDSVLHDELLTGLACVPLVASGRAFIALSLLRITIESRCRTFFTPILRRILVTVISKTWQSQLLPKISCDNIKDPRSKKIEIMTSNRLKNEKVLTNVANRVTDLLYGDIKNSESGGRKRKSFENNEEYDEDCNKGALHDEIINLCHVQLDEYSSLLPVYNDKKDRIEKKEKEKEKEKEIQEYLCEIPQWFKSELLFYINKCSNENQLTSIILLRIFSWFSNQSSNHLFSFFNNIDRIEKNARLSLYTHHDLNFSHYSHKNIFSDIFDWMNEGILTIFNDNFRIKNITTFLPLWTGVHYYFPIKNEKLKKINFSETILKFKSFKIKFNVLKSFILCSMSEIVNNIDTLISSILLKITNYFHKVDMKDIELNNNYICLSFQSCSIACFLSFLSLFEFLIQLLSHLSIHMLNVKNLIQNLKKLIFIATGLRRNISFEFNNNNNYDNDYDNHNNHHDNSNNNNNSNNNDNDNNQNDDDDDNNDYSNNEECNKNMYDINSNENDYQKYKKIKIKKLNSKEKKIQKKLSILSLVIMTSGIGYILSRKFSSEETLSLLMDCKDFDFLNAISILFNSDPFYDEINKYDNDDSDSNIRNNNDDNNDNNNNDNNNDNKGNSSNDNDDDGNDNINWKSEMNDLNNQNNQVYADTKDNINNSDLLKERNDKKYQKKKSNERNKNESKNENKITNFIKETQNLDSSLSHPAISILINYFFMPHIGSQNYDKLIIKKYYNNIFFDSVDPQKDFSILNLQFFLNYLPSVKNILNNLFECENIFYKNKEEKNRKSCFLPDIHSMNRIDFNRLINQLNSRFNDNEKNIDECETSYLIYNGKKIQKISNQNGMDLSLFGIDILVHILSFLSFKRICRLSCASSSFSSASKEHSLWEILYRRKFRNLLFENYGSDDIDNNDNIKKNMKNKKVNKSFAYDPNIENRNFLNKKKQCEECFHFSSEKLKRKRRILPCPSECDSHYWLGLFQVR